MFYCCLGFIGLKFFVLFFGVWVIFGDQIVCDEVCNLIVVVWDNGINFFDNVEGYVCGWVEQVMGDVIVDLCLLCDGFCVFSKVFFGVVDDLCLIQYGLLCKYVIDVCYVVFKCLWVDYFDFYYCYCFDLDILIVEIVQVMDILIWQGKVLYWGILEWLVVQIQEVVDIVCVGYLYVFLMEQLQYNLLYCDWVECEYVLLYVDVGLGIIIWLLLVLGLLIGKYNVGVDVQLWFGQVQIVWLKDLVFGDLVEQWLEKVCCFIVLVVQFGQLLVQLVIVWCLCNFNVFSVIFGVSWVGQLQENLGVLWLFDMMDEIVWQQVDVVFD